MITMIRIITMIMTITTMMMMTMKMVLTQVSTLGAVVLASSAAAGSAIYKVFHLVYKGMLQKTETGKSAS